MLLLLGHLLGTAWRAGSLWILLELTAMSLFGWVFQALCLHLVKDGNLKPLPWLAGGMALALLPVLAIAAYVQLAWGRADLKAGQRLMSWALALGLVLVALGGAGFTPFALGRTGSKNQAHLP